jgi:hypothetical protein
MRRQDHLYPISRQQPHKIPGLLPCRMRQNQVLVLELHPVDSIRHLFHNPCFYGLVSTHGPFSVTATQCS